MIKIAESCSSPVWPISDESDDLETPLQVWNRLYGTEVSALGRETIPLPTCVNRSPNRSTLALAGNKSLTTRRGRRRRVRSREVELAPSSDDEVIEVKRKADVKLLVLPSGEADSSTIEDEPSPPPLKSSGRVTRSSSRKRRPPSTHKSTRKKKIHRKPLEFLDESTLPSSENATSTASDLLSRKSNEKSDSQETILLDTPELGDTDSFEVQNQETSYDQDQPSNPLKDDRKKTDQDRQSPVEVEESDPDNATQPFVMEVEPTELDDIFFKPLPSKKPPPARTQKKKIGNFIFNVVDVIAYLILTVSSIIALNYYYFFAD